MEIEASIQRGKWEIHESPLEVFEESSQIGGFGMVFDKVWSLGKKIVITGVVVSSVPVVVPPLMVISTLGFVFSVPFGVAFICYACTEKIMSSLFPKPRLQLEDYQIVIQGSGNDGEMDALEDKPDAYVGEERIAEEKSKSGERKKVFDEEKKNLEVKFDEEQSFDREKEENRTVVADETVFVSENGVQGEIEGSVVQKREEEGKIEELRDEMEGKMEIDAEKESVVQGKEENGTVAVDETVCFSETDVKGDIEKNLDHEKEEERKIEDVPDKTEGKMGIDEGEENVDELKEENEATVADETGLVSGEGVKAEIEEPGKIEELRCEMNPQRESEEEEEEERVDRAKKEIVVEHSTLVLEKNGEVKEGLTSDSAYYSSLPVASVEGNVVSLEASDTKSTDSVKQPVSSYHVESKPGVLYEKEAFDPQGEDLYTEEKIWEQIEAMRTIVGYKAAVNVSCTEELKALYLFTGVEPPVSFKDSPDLIEVNDKLRFLKAVVGVK